MEDRIAVLYIWKSKKEEARLSKSADVPLSYYTSVPYISVVQNFRLPFQKTGDYRKQVETLVKNIINLYKSLTKSPFEQKTSILEMHEPESEKILIAEYGQANPELAKKINELESSGTHPASEPSSEPTKYMRRIGEDIFCLTATFRYLFNHDDYIDMVQIITNDEYIPWEWAFHREREEFLCEKMACGTTILSDLSRPRDIEFSLRDSYAIKGAIKHNDSVLLFGSDCSFSDDYPELKHLIKEGEKIEKTASSIFKKTTFNRINYQLRDFRELLRSQLTKCRILHLCGHFVEDGLYTTGGIISSTWLNNNIFCEATDRFRRNPIVFLNGCFSGKDTVDPEIPGAFVRASETIYSMARYLLGVGASACIITRKNMEDELAMDFADSFYNYFISERMAIGPALQNAKIDIKEKYPGDISWLFYILYGDPIQKLID